MKAETFSKVAKFAVGAWFNPAGIPKQMAELAVDRVAGWLPVRERERYERLIERVAGELARSPEVAPGGEAVLEPAVAAASDLFQRHGLSATELARLGFNQKRADAELLRRGRDRLDGADERMVGLCKAIVAAVHGGLLSEREGLDALEPAFREAVLGHLAKIDGLPEETALALRRLAGRALLRDPVRRWHPGLAASALLQAEYAVVPFAPRRELTDDLLAWCEDGAEVGVRLYTGPGGRGKTRLMIEMCRQLRGRGWAAGFLVREAAEAPAWALPAVLDGREDRFIVIDYAETRRDELAKLLDLAADGRAGGKVRFVLLARGVADWWRELARSPGAVGALLTGPATAEPIEVGALATEAEDRRRLFDTAVRAFAERLGKPAAEAAPAPDLTAGPFASALFLHMVSLAALDGRTVADATELLDHALRKEERSWEGNRAALGLDDLSVEAIAQAAALVTLAGGAVDRATASAIVGRAPRLRGQAADRRERLVSLLHRLYPGARAAADEEDGPAGGAWLEAVRPDLLGEHLVHRELTGDASLIDAALPEEVGTAAIASALTVLTRLAQRRPKAEWWLERAFARHLDRVAEIAVSVAVETGDPIGRLLAAAMERTPVTGPKDLEHAYRLMGLWPAQTVALRELRVVVTEQCLEALRAVPERDDDFRALIARIANNLSIYQRDLGRREEALSAAAAAVEVYRALAASRPDAFQPYLAASLNNLATMLSELGRREEALSAAAPAAEIYRVLAASRPDAFQPYLGTSLNNLATMLSGVGRREEALPVVAEAVAVYRVLVASRPDAFRPDLALALNNLATMLSSVGRGEEALSAAAEAVEVYRALVASRPDAFRPHLAVSVAVLANCLEADGREEEGLGTNREAIVTLAGPFCALPQAFADWMGAMVGQYRQRCEKLGREPDGELLAPIVAAFQRMQRQDNGGEG